MPRLDARHVCEARVHPLEGDGDLVGRAVAVLGDDEVSFARARVVAVIGGFAVQQDHDVGVLLERPRLTQVGERRLLVGALFRSAVELGEGDDRVGRPGDSGRGDRSPPAEVS